MKQALNLNAMGVTEMSQQEMLNVEGGCVVCKIVKAVGDAIKEAVDKVVEWVEKKLHD
jgi:hypothetical protein